MRIQVSLGLLLCSWLVLTSCEKEETPIVLPPKPADVSLMTVELGADYHRQVFVNLTTGQQTVAPMDCWDLAFDASPEGKLIFMNGGNNVLIANIGYGNFKQAVPLSALKWRWDAASGQPDSLVLSKCFNSTTRISLDSVYMINRGKGNTPDNFFQFKLLSVSATAYEIRIADVNGQMAKDITIPKDPNKVHVYFSFDKGGEALNFEPPKSDWHFCFLRYRWIYYEFNPPLLYQVTGVYTNTSFVDVAVDSTIQFYDIKTAQISGLPYYTNRDVIGFNWKTPDFKPTGVEYKVRKHVNYIIREKSVNNSLYKLRFIDFYNDKGEKGCPRFEMQLLH